MKRSGAYKRITKLSKVLAEIVVAVCISATLICFILMLLNYPGMDIAFCIALALSIIVILHCLLRSLRAKYKYSKLALVLHRCFQICLVIALAGFLVLQGLIISEARTEGTEADCLIVLGAGLYGEVPSRSLVVRLDTALAFLNAGNDIPIIVSGGQGAGETITEAEAMFRYLSHRGVDESLIWKEDKSTSTWENLAFSLAVMEKNGLDADNTTIAIVTNEFHLYRAKHIAGSLGLSAIGVAAETPYLSLRVLYHCREAVALLKDFLVRS